MKFKLLNLRVDEQSCMVNLGFDQRKYSDGKWVPGRGDTWIPVSRADAAMLCYYVGEEVNVSVYPDAPSVGPQLPGGTSEDTPGT